MRESQIKRLKELRANRNEADVQRCLEAITKCAETGEGNLLALAVEAAKCRASLGEISMACEKVAGRYKAVIRSISGVYSMETKNDARFEEAVAKANEFAKLEGRRPRIMIAKMGQDGHDRGAKVVATGYADIGFDVDMGPLFQTPAEAAKQAVENSILVYVTDDQGRFTYTHAKAGEVLRFAHMVFEPAYYTIKDKDVNGKDLTVRMKIKSHELLEVQVTANAPHIAFDNPVMSVIDYTLRDDGIYLIAYRRRNSSLIHLSFDLDTLHELPISSRYQTLNKDAFGDIYALNDYQASLVGFMELENGKKIMMNLYHSMPRKEFYDKFSTGNRQY